ncbi:MAG: undecaprenyldiphospho-muramoylpentapeptide beta-N- acetylglucosaminyltransferase [Candidatus Uhrbacteria bacterium GW2011_GWD2_52_7]|uniref:Undecaprenyldiphospho-muramoylpentapeptide beta-N-acetylglucosaminyltransferase n=1 Tax=Candidatus Uhrbacteria bacterium GW2011_GWD2_52_7 TaxID=1618989 RepID=A0A0G1XB73_9BACT|nr:MAG: undecaprenyldiphospho-muramoylpentapeptide beta-N- acetylglucosaminyltransferase [Candidatus Uhrbacteria bacterium GW2011_GWD2_52_7]
MTPLLAIAAEWRRREPDVKFSWIGTPKGPERALVEAAKIPFYALAAPKLDRSRPWTIPFVPVQLLVSALKSISLLRSIEPHMVMSAGAYVSVPVAWVAWFMRIPVWIHQLDVEPGVANKLMAPVAKRISITWEASMNAFSSTKTLVVGCMARKMLRLGERQTALEMFGFDASLPTVMITGGSSGAQQLNDAMLIIGHDLAKRANVLHLTGKGKMHEGLNGLGKRYVAFEFLQETMADAYALADVVVARAGMGTIAELVALGKPTILVPLPGHQELNAKALEERKAAEVLRIVTPQTLKQAIERLLDHPERREELAKHIRSVFPLNADERIVHAAIELLDAGKV